MAEHRQATRMMQVSERSNVQIQCSGLRNVQRVAQKDPWLTVWRGKGAGNLDRDALHLARDFLRANGQQRLT